MPKSLLRSLTLADIKETILLSIPIIIAQLGTVLMGVADIVMVGRLGTAELAAAGFANSVYFFLIIIPIGFFLVVAPMVSSAQSAGNTEECGRLYQAVIQLSVALTIVFTLLLYGVLLFFGRLGQTAEVNALAPTFYTILIWSTFPLLLFIALKQLTDGLSKTYIAMYITLFGLLFNVLMNWVLIYGNLGAPAYGLAGAGYATLLSRILMAASLWIYIEWSPETKAYLKPFSVHKETLLRIINIGLPSGFQFFYEVAAFSAAAVIAGWLSTVALAAHNIAINIASVTYMVSAGIGTAAGIRVGNARGTNNKAQMQKAALSGYLITIIFMGGTCLIMLLFNGYLVSLYNSELQVHAVATTLIVIAAFFQLSDGIQSVSLGVLRAISDVTIPSFITLSAYWVIALPVGYVLTIPMGMGAAGIWIGLLVGLTISATFLTVRFFRGMRGVAE